jgi:hypothetical protein
VENAWTSCPELAFERFSTFRMYSITLQDYLDIHRRWPSMSSIRQAEIKRRCRVRYRWGLKVIEVRNEYRAGREWGWAKAGYGQTEEDVRHRQKGRWQRFCFMSVCSTVGLSNLPPTTVIARHLSATIPPRIFCLKRPIPYVSTRSVREM